MTTMTRAVALFSALSLLPGVLQAQPGPPMDRGARGPGLHAPGAPAHPAEGVLALREHLQLRDDQLQELDRMRREAVERRVTAFREAEALRSRVRAGELARDELRVHLRARVEAGRERRAEERDRLESLLDEDQLEAWEEVQRDRMRRGRVERRHGGALRMQRRPADREGPRGALRRGGR